MSEILIVASDPTDRRDISERLTSAGYDFAFADSAFMQLRGKTRPLAVVVHDVARGKSDPVLAVVRSRHPGLCVIIITGNIEEAEYARLLSLGATAVVPSEDADMMLIPLLESNLAAEAEAADARSEALSAPPARTVTVSPVPPPAPVFAPAPAPAPARPAVRSGSVNVKVATWAQYALLYTSDLSKGGLFIRMQDPPPVGTPLLVRLGLPSGDVLDLPVSIVHVLDAQTAAQAGKNPGVGVSFTEWGDALKQRFADLHQQARQGAAPTQAMAPLQRPPAPAARPPAPPLARPPVAPPAPPRPVAPVPPQPPARAPGPPPLPGARPPVPSAAASTTPARPGANMPAGRPQAPPPAAPPPPAPAPAPAQAAPAAGIPSGKTGASLATALREHIDEIRRKDYFTLLGVTPDAEPGQIRKSFLALAKEWHPGRFALEPDGVRELVAEIFISFKTAHDEIIEEEKRTAYKAKLARRAAAAAQQGSSVSQLPGAPWVYTPPPAPSSTSVVRPLPGSVAQQRPAPNSVVQARPAPNSVVQQRPAPNSVVQARPAPGSVVQQRPAPNSVVQARPAPGSVVQQRPAPGSVVQRPPEPPRQAPPPPPARPQPPARQPSVPPPASSLEDTLSLESLSLDSLDPMPGFAPTVPLQGLDIGLDIDVPIEVDNDSVVAPVPTPPPPNQDLARADHFIKGGFFRAAQQALERALLSDPDNAILKGRLGVAEGCEALRKADFDRAAKMFREACDANPTDELAVEGLRALAETKKDDRRGILKRLLSR